MALYDNFPYTNFHEMNLDWVIKSMKELESEWESFNADVTASAQSGNTAAASVTGDLRSGLNFDFTLPKGDTGATGPQGPQGPRGNDNVYTGQADLVSGSLIVQTDTGDFVSDDNSVIFIRFNDTVPANANSYPVVIDSNDPHYLSVNNDSLEALSEEIPAGSILAVSWTGNTYYVLTKDFGGSLPDSGVTAGTYGSFVSTSKAITLPVITVDSKGIITNATNLNIGQLTNIVTTTIAAGSTTTNLYPSAISAFNVILYRSSAQLTNGYQIVPESEYDVYYTASQIQIVLKESSALTTYVSVWGILTTITH